MVDRLIRFSSQRLESLKAHATDPQDRNNWVSTYEALAALLYQSVYRERLQHHGDDPSLLSRTDFLFPVNLRVGNKLSDLPLKYFPNALQCACT